MKLYIRSSISPDIISQAENLIKSLKGSYVDRENHEIVVVFPPHATKEQVMDEGMLGKWFVDHGFDVSFEVKDVEYQTQGEWTNYRGWVREKPHTAYLRNRLVLTARW